MRAPQVGRRGDLFRLEGALWEKSSKSTLAGAREPFFSSSSSSSCRPVSSLLVQCKCSDSSLSSPATSRRRGLSCNAAKWAERLSHELHPYDPSLDDSAEAGPLSSGVNRTNGKTNGALSSSSFPALTERCVSLPLDYYKVLGADTHFLADAIVRAYESRVKNLPREGFSQDALMARQEILRGACETLADPELRGEYNEVLVSDETGTVMVDVPLSKVPGALCLLQEVGEMEVVMQIGEELLQERLGKFFQRDVILAMALAYVELSREAMAESPPAIVRSCELLERALKLLQEEGGSSLAPSLQEQIDETLQQINPRCILELLALPLDKEHRGRREEGLHSLRSILWALGEGGVFAHIPGYTRDEFMKAAFVHMTAAEQVALFTATPSNIPAESAEVLFVALAHVAEGFVAKKPRLIQEADMLFLQLQQTNASVSGIGRRPSGDLLLEFLFERGMCQLLLGELDDCQAWLGLDDTNSPYRDPAVTDFVIANSVGSEEGDYLPGLCKLLESWLREVVFSSFRDTEYLRVKLRDYYDDPGVLNYLEKLEKGEAPRAAAAAIVQIGAGAGAALDSVKETLQKVFPLGRAGATSQLSSTVQAAGSASTGSHQQEYISIPGVAPSTYTEGSEASGRTWDAGEVDEEARTDKKGSFPWFQIVCAGLLIGALTFRVRRVQLPGYGVPKALQTLRASVRTSERKGSISSAGQVAPPSMDAVLAEHLVQKWQAAKAQALGQDHAIEKLSEVLNGGMLKRWSERARDVSKNGWFWEYKLEGLNIESVTISTDGKRALVEATLKEGANLYDENKLEVIDSYGSSYTTRYEFSAVNGVWKITSGAVLRS